MSQAFDVSPRNDRELVIGRILDCTPEAAFRCWTEPKLLTQWFTPPPWTTPEATIDLRVGGVNEIVMQGPNGERVPNRGVYLEVVPNRKLVFTNAFTDAWTPNEVGVHGLNFVGTITFEPEAGGKTRYTARAAHWTQENKAQHESMGFAQGWGQVADQLEALAKTI